jgi:RNA polymerase sigma-70 factor (ECF subfamily)
MTEITQQEKELVLKAKAGDRKAFETLVHTCAKQVYNLAYRLSNSKESAEDIAQETFINAYNSIGRFSHDCPFANWVYRIAVNAWKNRVRYERRRFFFQHDSLDETIAGGEGDMKKELPDKKPGADEEFEKFHRKEAIDKALNKLNPQAKEMLVLRDIEELSYEEISGIIKTPLGTVKSRIARAREALKEHLKILLGEDYGS